MYNNSNVNSFDFDSNASGDGVNYNDIDINMMDNNMNTGMMGGNMMQGGCCGPVSECPQERCVHRTIMHDVPHVCPIRTRIINHHVYRHTYRPEYSCSEENVVSNVQCGSCSQFR